MASLQKVKVKGHTYWRVVESRRVNGKPRPVPILHLGTVDQLMNRLLAAEGRQLRLRSFQHGDVAALKAVADRLQVARLIDEQLPAQKNQPSVGTTLLLAALNRAIHPCSKRGWATWAEGTSLPRLFGLDPQKLTSQFFWQQMDGVSESALQKIEAELTRRVIACHHLTLDTLLYDTTNFFTYIASTNKRSQLAQRGHSKQRRTNLRQLSLALLVSKEDQIPLCSHLYAGNLNDAGIFPQQLTLLRQRLEKLVGELQGLTLVYDKGNNSKKNQKLVDQAPFSYVGSICPHHHSDLLAIPLKSYTPLRCAPDPDLRVYRCKKQIWGVERTVLMFLSDQLREGQIRGLQQHLTKSQNQLLAWQAALAKPHSGPRSPAAAQRRISALLAPQHLKKILTVAYDPDKEGSERLTWQIDTAALEELQDRLFGKRILITNRQEWSNEDILAAYRGQSRVEAAFRQLKDPFHLALRPQFHWTDQKIRVHAFICLLALLLARLLERQARQAGFRGNLDHLLDLLATVRLTMILRPSGAERGRPRTEWTLEEAEPSTLDLFRTLVPNQRPFVYTAPSA